MRGRGEAKRPARPGFHSASVCVCVTENTDASKPGHNVQRGPGRRAQRSGHGETETYSQGFALRERRGAQGGHPASLEEQPPASASLPAAPLPPQGIRDPPFLPWAIVPASGQLPPRS